METFWGQLGLVVAGAILGAALTAILAVLDHRRNVKSDREAREQEFRRAAARERETRHEEHLWRRREEFERLVAEFVPVYERWSWLQGVLNRMAFRSMGDMDPEPDEADVDDLGQEVNKYIAQLKVRSPSEAIDRALASVSEAQHSVWTGQRYINHVLLKGDDEAIDAAPREFMDKLDAFDEAVRALTSTASSDGRRQGRSGYASSPAQG